MTEELLQHIWQFQYFKLSDINNFIGTQGETISVVNVGFKNSNQGPDFSNAKIIIDGIEWNGNIEIHLKSSLWNSHKHQFDKKYDNVILHVVLEDDKPIFRPNGELIPTIEVSNVLDNEFVSNYNSITQSNNILPCQSSYFKVREIIKKSMLERVLIERLERKSKLFESWLKENNEDWEKTTFEVVAYCLGLKVNASQMRELLHSNSFKTLMKHHDSLFQIESLMFGVAGFLNGEAEDNYKEELSNEYKFLKSKYALNEFDKEFWNFSRMRPSSFPTVRIAQLCELLHQNQSLFQKIKDLDVEELKNAFDVKFDKYWAEHHNFGKKRKSKAKGIGSGTIDLILINGIVPLLYLYYKKTNQVEYLNKAFNVLESIKSEKNSKVDELKEFFNQKSAYDSQSVLELYDYYCLDKRCLNCNIFSEIV